MCPCEPQRKWPPHLGIFYVGVTRIATKSGDITALANIHIYIFANTVSSYLVPKIVPWLSEMSLEELLLSCHGLVPVPLQAPSNALLVRKSIPPGQGRSWYPLNREDSDERGILALEVPGQHNMLRQLDCCEMPWLLLTNRTTNVQVLKGKATEHSSFKTPPHCAQHRDLLRYWIYSSLQKWLIFFPSSSGWVDMIQEEELLIKLHQKNSQSPFLPSPKYPRVSESAPGPTISCWRPVITEYINGFGHYTADQPEVDALSCILYFIYWVFQFFSQS